MRINIKGNAVTPDNIADALKECEKNYGLKVRCATVYVTFEDDNRDVVEPTKNGETIIRDFIYNRTKEVPERKSLVDEIKISARTEPLTEDEFKEAIETLQQMVRKLLSPSDLKIFYSVMDIAVLDKKAIKEIALRTMLSCSSFSMRYFEGIVLNLLRQQSAEQKKERD